MLSWVAVALVHIGAASGLRVASSAAGLRVSVPPRMIATTAPVATERYIATNRFRVKDGREAVFEKRWADRKSRLGLLDGFRFFCMLRRLPAKESKEHIDDINYISCTVWESFANFEAWKTGDAFKEAHGGGTIGGIADMLVATAMNTKGKPKAAMWEGVLPVSMPPPGASDSAAPIAWRDVEADGKAMLDGECFIAMNRFSVKEGMEGAFEERFAQRESTLEQFDGFKGFLLLRRDGSDPDGVTHSTWSVWKDRASFDAWMGAEKKPTGPPAAAEGAAKPPPIYAKPPVPTFYEGILVLESGKGI